VNHSDLYILLIEAAKGIMKLILVQDKSVFPSQRTVADSLFKQNTAHTRVV